MTLNTVVGATQTALSISETTDLWGCSCTTPYNIYGEHPEEREIFPEQHFFVQKCLVLQTKLGASPFSQQETGATIPTGSPKRDNSLV